MEELRLYINKKIPTIATPFFKEKTTKALSTLPSANVKKAQLDLYRQELATIIIDNVTYEIENFHDVKKHMTASTMKIVDFLLNEDIKFVGNTFRSSVKEFMEFRGLKDFNNAKQQLIDGFRFLSKLVWTSEEKKKGKKVGSSTRISIWGGYSNVEDGKIEFTFGEKFLESLEGCSVKKKSRQLMNTNDHKNPYSYFFGDTITTHKHMNRLKSNANLISVRTIISKCPIFPTYDEVITTGRQIQQRIIDPFERDMTALSEMFSWEYCHTNGIPLSDDEIQNFNYDVFINCLVKIVWKNDPYIEEVKNKTLKIGQKKPV
ncbi:hypothetical protein FACS1894122_07850 [Alphaproteobacteria bacterium]|nr:hypothetical protein FACS1894122_07850 [Alphaproteobacteria bacterium]